MCIRRKRRTVRSLYRCIQLQPRAHRNFEFQADRERILFALKQTPVDLASIVSLIANHQPLVSILNTRTPNSAGLSLAEQVVAWGIQPLRSVVANFGIAPDERSAIQGVGL